MGHRRRRRRIDGQRFDRAALDARENLRQAVHVHRFVQTIADGLFDQRMIGKLHRSGAIVLAHHLFGKHRGQKIFGAHALKRHGNFACRRCDAGSPERGWRSSASGWSNIGEASAA